jgi:hypothetical protein
VKQAAIEQEKSNRLYQEVRSDPQFGGKGLALIDEKVWFPYILDSGAFTTVVRNSLLKKLKEAGSGVVESTLEKDVEMKMAVKDTVTIAKSMIHITVQLTTRAGPVRIRSLSALVAQDEMEYIGCSTGRRDIGC